MSSAFVFALLAFVAVAVVATAVVGFVAFDLNPSCCPVLKAAVRQALVVPS